jgi:hypothetical protein
MCMVALYPWDIVKDTRRLLVSLHSVPISVDWQARLEMVLFVSGMLRVERR